MRDRLTRDIKKALGDQVQVERRYYSWTGDREDHTGCLPEHRDWLDGSKHIRTDWPELLRAAPGRKIVIIGWSNGGATAYELACSLSKSAPERVSLLVTLDPVSRLTEPTDYCRRQDGTLIRPARMWIGVYTRSAGLDIISRTGNIIAWFGNAWNDAYPAGDGNRARPIMKLYPANHGDVERMWKECVRASRAYVSWAGSHGERTDRDNAVRAACAVRSPAPRDG